MDYPSDTINLQMQTELSLHLCVPQAAGEQALLTGTQSCWFPRKDMVVFLSAMVFRVKALTCKDFADTAQAVQSHSNQTSNIFHFSNGILLWTSLGNTRIYAHTSKIKKNHTLARNTNS